MTVGEFERMFRAGPASQPREWHGEPHTLTVTAVTLPEDQFDDGELEYEIQHPPGCPEESYGDPETGRGYTDYACDIAYHEKDCGLAYALRYSGTPVTGPGTYRIQGWGRRIWTESGDEYDAGVGIMTEAGDGTAEPEVH